MMKPAEQEIAVEEVRESTKPRIQVNTTKPQQVDDRWMEFKVIGKNIQPRSYHVAVVYGSYLYVHGGYDVDKGFLSDFYRLQLENQLDGFKWEQLSEESVNYPGRRKGHSAVVYRTSMILFGGQVHDGEGTNFAFVYEFNKAFWDRIAPSADLPKLDSHAAFVIEDVMYVYGGFKDKEAVYSNNIYALDMKTRTWSTFYQPDKNAVIPEARGNMGLVVYKDYVLVFGGTNGTKTLNDLWKFDMNTKTWSEIKSDHNPEPRRSHTMVVYENNVYLFAGIQDVTKEKNDIFIFSPESGNWTRIHNSSNLVYECSPTIKRNRSGEKKVIMDLTQKGSSPGRKKEGGPNQISLLGNNFQKTAPSDKNEGMKRIIEENRMKKFMERKQELLKEFSETPSDQPRRKLSPTSENMMKTLQLIGDQEHSKRVMHQQVVYDPTRKYILGKKPCARDAHTAVVYSDKMLIFGGDRHLMSFSDLYYFDLRKGLESKKLYEESKKE